MIKQLADDPAVHGILVQLPLPPHIFPKDVIDAIPPEKDVDCLTSANVGKLIAGNSEVAPCTPQGILDLLCENNVELDGANCVIIGRSDIVGKPLAAMLTNANATVTLCHSHTKNLKAIARKADILVSAVGKPGFVTKQMVKRGAVVIDVGINRDEDGKLVGDVCFDSVSKKASLITPVPGGVGVMTVTELLLNTIEAAMRMRGKE